MFFNKVEKQIEQLLNCFKEFQVTDLIGFGKILNVEEKEDFSDFCTNICMAFANEDSKKRKELLRLAKDIKIANINMVAKEK